MAKGFGASLIKTILLLLNLALFVGGVACVVLSFLVLLDKPRLNALLDLQDGSGTTVQTITASAVIVNIVGWVIIIFSVVGCCGAGWEKKIVLGFYIGLTGLLIIIQVVGAGLASFYTMQTETAIKSHLMDKLKTQYDGRGDSTMDFTRSLDFAHQEFECCGVHNYTDFKNLADKWTERKSRTIPIGCCKLNKTEFYNRELFDPLDVTCTTAPTRDNAYIDKPCVTPIREHLMGQAVNLIVVSFLLVIVEFVGIVLSCILMRTIKDTAV